MKKQTYKKILSYISISLIFVASVAQAHMVESEIDYHISQSSSDTVSQLEKSISEKEEELERLKGETNEYIENIKLRQEQGLSLENEIALLDNAIARSELEIQRIAVQIEKTNLEIEKVNADIEEKQKEIDHQKEKIAELLRLVHKNDQVSYLEVLILNDSFSEFFDQLQYLRDVQIQIKSSLKELNELRRNLEINELNLEIKFSQLSDLKVEHEKEQIALEEEKESKEVLLAETQNSEQQFQNLLAQIRFEQRSLQSDIARIEDEIAEKLRRQNEINPDFIVNPDKLMWPIPNQGVATYFRDPSYPFRRIVGEHSGLDMRTLIDGVPSNGMKLRAAADGIVVKIIDNGRYTGNAVYIAHGDELMTVYLHMSRVDVIEDDIVRMGDTIGLTGGSPGTYGAGLSSGPHLHFEVRLNGLPVNPCEYLDPECEYRGFVKG